MKDTRFSVMGMWKETMLKFRVKAITDGGKGKPSKPTVPINNFSDTISGFNCVFSSMCFHILRKNIYAFERTSVLFNITYCLRFCLFHWCLSYVFFIISLW